MGDDTIYRQAAIDVIDFEDKWIYDAKSHNADTHMAFDSMRHRLKSLPSAQPEIIRCNDCKYYISYTPYGLTLGFCNRLGFQAMELDDFCSRAERRANG